MILSDLENFELINTFSTFEQASKVDLSDLSLDLGLHVQVFCAFSILQSVCAAIYCFEEDVVRRLSFFSTVFVCFLD